MKYSSRGVQPKKYKDGYWYKWDALGYEGLAEELVSKFCSYIEGLDYVQYECIEHGCKSKDFIPKGFEYRWQ